jgi:hypothetical protein
MGNKVKHKYSSFLAIIALAASNAFVVSASGINLKKNVTIQVDFDWASPKIEINQICHIFGISHSCLI